MTNSNVQLVRGTLAAAEPCQAPSVRGGHHGGMTQSSTAVRLKGGNGKTVPIACCDTCHNARLMPVIAIERDGSLDLRWQVPWQDPARLITQTVVKSVEALRVGITTVVPI